MWRGDRRVGGCNRSLLSLQGMATCWIWQGSQTRSRLFKSNLELILVATLEASWLLTEREYDRDLDPTLEAYETRFSRLSNWSIGQSELDLFGVFLRENQSLAFHKAPKRYSDGHRGFSSPQPLSFASETWKDCPQTGQH